MIEDGMNFLVEIGPHPVLLSGTRDIAEGVKRAVHLLPAMTRGSDVEPISRVIGAAHAVDIPVDILSFNGGEGHLIDLPLYPFQRQQHGFKHPEAQHNRLTESCHPFLGPSTSLSDTERGIIRLRLSTGVSPFLGDHVVDGAIVFPMTGHIEAAYLAASKYLIHQRIWLEDIRFEHPVVLAPAEDFAPQVMLEIVSPGNDFVISCRRADAIPAAGWQVCSRGRINPHDQPPGTAPESLNSVKARLQSGTEVYIDGFYQKFEDAGLRYDRAFRCVQSTWCFGNEAFSAVELPSSLNEEATRFTLHPALFDACTHTLYAHQHYVGDPSQVYLPSHIGGVHLAKDDAVTASFAHIQVYRHDSTFLACHVSIYGDCGQLVAKVTGLTTKRLRGKSISQPMEHDAHFQLEIEEQATYYGLVHFGRLTLGETVLVHSGAGGVGTAAIQLAKLIGARVYATAGSPARRAWVTDVGVEGVFDSRSLTLHDEIKLATNGRGVDVVLNCLTGATFSQSVACLAPFGRFLEIGTTDIYRNMRLYLEQFGQNCSFFAIDIDRLAAEKPALHSQIVNEICGLFKAGKLVPPPITTYPVTKLPTALKELSRSSVIGKAVVEMLDGVKIEAAPPSQLRLKEDRSYLITGGTSGLGLRLAIFLVERGARHLVLVSRSGPKSTEDHAIVSDLQRRGTTVSIERGDISNARMVDFLFHPDRAWPPIVGIIYSAGALRAASAHDLTMDSFWAVFAPKALVFWELQDKCATRRQISSLTGWHITAKHPVCPHPRLTLGRWEITQECLATPPRTIE
ncbi:Acyl transferase/acyl hydrolase/lysophospholipase [Penicillium desertorum]|uniref:Acyl transferase/acyl hydrolase/lysophospholipase n=1 Tax=Penicillium desertorum TaxID=1303715 RepID=A0A9X0BHN2_9EURO|nr:Acyl transferase/acyl hydrolase/lysophospholipase [Penicillium desertorum]